MKSLVVHLLKIVGVSIGAVLGFLLLIVVAAGLLLSTLPDMCGNSVLSEIVSPNGTLKAVVFSRDCGATTDFSTQVSVLKTGDALPNDGGNIFVADSDHHKAPAGPSGGPAIRVAWISDHQLRIEHHPMIRVLKAEPLWRDVRVGCVAVSPDE